MPVDLIPSFIDAKKRIFLSATLTGDSFLVRDLGVESECVLKPLSSGDVLYSGERLILIPSLMDPILRREDIITWIQGLARRHGNFGVVGIVPSFNHASYWEARGAKVTRVREIYKDIDELKAKIRSSAATDALVLVNEYDGVDLPDSTCRILTLDSLPIYNTLMDKYSQNMRPNSSIIRRQIAQRIEQGMGRAIRGSSDWCIVVVTGTNITNFLSDNSKRMFLSKEAQAQIKIGEELIPLLKKEGGNLDVFEKLKLRVVRENDELYPLADREWAVAPDGSSDAAR